MISVISIVILARILEPVNFGLIAISVTVIDLFEGFTVLWLNAGIIQGDAISKVEYDVAWTYGYLIRGILLFLIVLSSSEHIATFYELKELKLN